jgi:hypothetical protein
VYCPLPSPIPVGRGQRRCTVMAPGSMHPRLCPLPACEDPLWSPTLPGRIQPAMSGEASFHHGGPRSARDRKQRVSILHVYTPTTGHARSRRGRAPVTADSRRRRFVHRWHGGQITGWPSVAVKGGTGADGTARKVSATTGLPWAACERPRDRGGPSAQLPFLASSPSSPSLICFLFSFPIDNFRSASLHLWGTRKCRSVPLLWGFSVLRDSA